MSDQPKGADELPALLERIASALERLAPAPPPAPDFGAADAFVWRADAQALAPVPKVNRVEMGLLKGIDLVRDLLFENTERFANGLPANNALLWGARGMGKSSLVKAAHASINRGTAPHEGAQAGRNPPRGHREPAGAHVAAARARRSSSSSIATTCPSTREDTSYKSLKAALEGGIEGRPANVLFYATSNRRHLLPRDMMENERSTRDQSGRSGGGESVAVRPLRPVARIPPLQPGRISRDGERLLRALRT